ncbi:SMI1/KNR4 family protein [Pseudovibrio sp. JE062]|uniref:SMI1/KNR4 family protein n=1 Tax=Pseudovibrio sp. JE062 TaxID=439495 RepID=UPI0012EEBFC3|nr:SMI1/KNR4 family protein [Pseudovibrio sp. JE062]
MLENKKWNKNHAASTAKLIKLVSVSPFPLPASYLDFLSKSDGGEGPLAVQPCWLILFPAEEVADIEESATYHEFFPGHVVIGSNGGGVAIALTSDAERKTTVIAFDTTNIDLKESVVLLAPTFEALLAMLEDDVSPAKSVLGNVGNDVIS